MTSRSEFVRGFVLGFASFSILLSSINLLVKTHTHFPLKIRTGRYGAISDAKVEPIRGDIQRTKSDGEQRNWLDAEETISYNSLMENNSADFNLTIKRMSLLIIVHSSLSDANSVDRKILSTWGKDKTAEYIIATGRSNLTVEKVPPSVTELGHNDFLSSFDLTQEELGFLIWKIRQFYIDSYWWFLFIPSNTYVSLHYMNKLLEGMDPNVPVYMGHPIRDTSRDKTVYCKSGPGIVVSKALLQLMDKNINSCIIDSPQISSDMALGDCLKKNLKIDCHRKNVSNNPIQYLSLQCLQPFLAQKGFLILSAFNKLWFSFDKSTWSLTLSLSTYI